MTNTTAQAEPEPAPLDFSDTKIAFSSKSDKELKETRWLFRMMNKNWLVNLGSSLGVIAVKLNLPFAKTIVRSTIFKQFCGGEYLLDCQESIDLLYKHDVLTMLDYGAEGKNTDEELDMVMEEIVRAVEFAASNNSVPVSTVKMSGLSANALLEKVQNGEPLDEGEKEDWEQMMERITTICDRAYELGVGIFIDAEESWIQVPIDEIARQMMAKYNQERVIVYNTYQLYRHDKLAQIKQDHEIAKKEGYLLGAKLVRGAYMDKERERAAEMGYECPIQANKEATDRDFNLGLQYCADHYEEISFCCASHNAQSNLLLANIIEERGLDKTHRHLNFCQLYGMSDNITFNLAAAGFNVGKYVVYGPIEEVVPYLVRRAQENSSVTGDMSRELKMIEEEVIRRGI
jgi:proline dehydrogenase